MELPCDKFSNRLTFKISYASKNLVVLLTWVVTLVTLLITLWVHDISIKILVGVFYLYFQLMSIGLIFASTSISTLGTCMSPEDKMKFYAEIVNNQPYSEPKSWNIICYNMNEYFYENGYRSISLYDGNDCYHLFQFLVNGKKDSPDSNSKSSECTSDINSNSINDNSESSEISDKPTVDKSHLLYLDTAREKANMVFLKAENDYWVQKYPELAV